MWQSEIRPSEIEGLSNKVSERKYGKYLYKMTIKKLRGMEDQPIVFDFPVTAIIGPNGGGKTTILGAAACAYKDALPRRFFTKSGKYDNTMQDWSIEYELIDRAINKSDSFRRTSSFKKSRWKRDAPNRKLIIFGVSRTVPASERSELNKCAGSGFKVPKTREKIFNESIVKHVPEY